MKRCQFFKNTVLPLGILLTLLLNGSSWSQKNTIPHPFLPCGEQPEKQNKRSNELQVMVEADQREREHWDDLSEEERVELVVHDLQRRKRVGEILGEGCFSEAKDYAAAALIFQHGDSSDHYFQAFIWSSRAVQLGLDAEMRMMAMSIDRYLVAIGQKQLFGSQAYASDMNACFCLEPVEESFPDLLRKKYTDLSLIERFEWLKTLNETKVCENKECLHPLKPSPKGSIQGFW